MAKKQLTILQDIKSLCGIVPEYNNFDNQLLVYINSAFATLHQLGVGPEDGFEVDETTDWDEFYSSCRLNFIKAYVNKKVRLMFDPPTSSFALAEIRKQIEEDEWRITSEVECNGEED